ncbi:MAG: hypothetical protein EAZ89_07315, partial [Bacteroidetes bacterium]
MSLTYFFEQFLEAFIGQSLIFFLFVIPFFLVFWVWGRKRWKPIRIQEVQRATRHHFSHDLKFTFSTFILFAAMDVFLIYLQSKGYTKIYSDFGEYGWAWAGISFFLLLFLNDTFFYWSHRAMHHPRLYRFFHKVHHESTDPSPLTSGAFHPSEAVVENVMFMVLPFVMPLHMGVIIVWQIFDMLNNVLAHLGYELYPAGWTKTPVLKWKTASVHHNMHHQLFHGNYALYFTWWDKWMGTEFKDYEQRHQQIFERKKQAITREGLYHLKVDSVHPEAGGAVTIQINEVPLAFKSFAAGQHITLKLTLNGETLYRTFSISSVPDQHQPLTLTIKKVSGGKVTPYLSEQLRPGDTLEATVPGGSFCITPEPGARRHYIMIAGGSGITPIYSMIGSVLHTEPQSKITLLYANRDRSSIIFKEKLEAWEKKFPSQLTIRHFLSSEKETGRIGRTTLEALLNDPDKRTPDFYLCGPDGMTSPLISDLRYLGVPQERIHR